MEYRKLGDSDLEVSAIVFGAWAAGGWMWSGVERGEAVDAIRQAYDNGVTSIDTAPVYGQGLSEEIVGEAIKGLPRDKVQLFTKFGLRWDKPVGEFYFQSKDNTGKEIDIYKHAGKEQVIAECESSLRRLGTDYIDLYQIHWPDPSTPIEESMEAVSQLMQQGKVRYAGVCNYNEDQLEAAEDVVNIVSDQVPYSMLNRSIEEVVLPYCLANSKSILAYSPLERGLLTGKIRPGYKFAEGDHRVTHRLYTEENIRRVNDLLKKLKPIADANNATLGQLVLRWTIEKPGITAVLVGARNASQAIENARATDIAISSADFDFMNSALNDFSLVSDNG